MRDQAKATKEQIEKAPVGDLIDRNWSCAKHGPDRKRLADELDVQTVARVEVRGNPAWERALVARPPLPKRTNAKTESFTWEVKPKAFPVW